MTESLLIETQQVRERIEQQLAQLREGLSGSTSNDDGSQEAKPLDLSVAASGDEELRHSSDQLGHGMQALAQAYVSQWETIHGPAHDAASALLAAFPEQIETQVQRLHQGIADAEDHFSKLTQCNEDGEHDCQDKHQRLEQVVRESAREFETNYARLEASIEAYAADANDHLQPALVERIQAFQQVLTQFRDATFPASESRFRSVFGQSEREYMDVVERVCNLYRDAARDCAADLERSASDHFTNALEASMERLRSQAISMIEREIEDAITETNLSVAISGALSPVMPELILFYKAVSLLEEAIRIFKEIKKALSFGF